MNQTFTGRMRVLNEYYKRELENAVQVAPEKSYGPLKMPEIKVCKCDVASIVNGF